MLQAGDVILADISFDILMMLGYVGKLEIPSFTRRKKQLSQKDIEYSQKLAKACVHVE